MHLSKTFCTRQTAPQLLVTTAEILGTILGDCFSAKKVKNTRQYIQYCLRFLPLPDEKTLRR